MITNDKISLHLDQHSIHRTFLTWPVGDSRFSLVCLYDRSLGEDVLSHIMPVCGIGNDKLCGRLCVFFRFGIEQVDDFCEQDLCFDIPAQCSHHLFLCLSYLR